MNRDLVSLTDAVRDGDRRSLARALTLVEDGDPATLRELLGALHPLTGRARVLGLTGPPGVGKSTLSNAIASVLRGNERTVAIVAIDPSSPFSGGALLGDRVRMQSHHADEGVFIRSMAARGHLGGCALATPHAVAVLDAAGFDDVLIETVGVGQSEVEVAGTADTTVVALAPGMGDSIQAAKAGILEVADVFVVNKADQPGAGKLESELRHMLEMGHELDGGAEYVPPIVRTVAVRAEGVEELVARCDDHLEMLERSGLRSRRRHERAAQAVREIALEQVRRRFVHLDADVALDELAVQVADGSLDPYTAADRLLDASGVS